MIVKVHNRSGGKKIISICDKELVGKKFNEKKIQLDLSSNFYKGKEKTEEDVRKIVKEAYILNIAGKKSVGFCLKEGWISKNNIMRIKNIPYATCLFINN